MSKYPVSFRLTIVAKQLLIVLADHLGISKTGVVELAIREKADRHEVRKTSDIAMVEEKLPPHPEKDGNVMLGEPS